ncbi:MAG: hypothetical protein J0M12_10990 [Deltaproteobacteria bacterium]|nr:hypothetical protein [Deltaproteobacteria bacterium]
MRLLRCLCAFGLAIAIAPSFARADEPAALDAYMQGYADASAVAMATSCDKKLDDNGVGSTCSCTASGSASTCICSGSGQQKVCSCSDGTNKTYCYFCTGGSGCECGPTNRSGQKCQTVTRSVSAFSQLGER